jgi:Na+-driven multidrug efflux pump/anti-sigma regulatory factor (Ser/Thr protein kinase)
VILLFTDPICTLLGAGDPTPENEVFYLTRDYLRGFVIGAPAFIAAQIMVPYMQMSGSRIRLIVAVAAMTVSDVVLDALNVTVFRQGMFGMGLASSISYYFAFIIGALYFFKKKCIFKLRFRLIRGAIFKGLAKEGVPALINQVSLVLLAFVLNRLLLGVGGNLAVAAYSVISTAGNICYSFSGGIASVALTLSTVLYSDEDKSSLRELVKIMLYYGVLVCSAVTLVVLIAASPIVTRFLTNPEAHDMAVTGLRLFILSLVPCSLNTNFKNYYQGICRVRLTMLISVVQNFAFAAFAAFIMSRFLGVTGIWLGFVVGELLTFSMISLYVRLRNKKKMQWQDVYAMLPDDFGVQEKDCFEFSVTDASQVPDVSQSATEYCFHRGLNSRLSTAIVLCIEEMTNNIVQHGFRGRQEHRIDVRLMIKESGPVLRIRDNCPNFDPVKYIEMHRDEKSSEHLGLRLVMSRVKEANYVNTFGLNCLTLNL